MMDSNDSRLNRSRDRGRNVALWAWESVEKAAGQSTYKSEDYMALALKLPSMLQVSGLGQTLAFLAAKGGLEDVNSSPKNGHRAIFCDIDSFLREGVFKGERSGRNTMEMVLDCEPSRYRIALREAQEMADWLKRFAQAKLQEEK